MARNNQEKGLWGEELAEKYLLEKGFEIITRRYRTRYGEIDLIAKDNDVVVFVEVKARTLQTHGTPAEAVTPEKQRHLTKAALQYLQKNTGMDVPCRFDVVEIYLSSRHICHIPNAFDACM